MRTGNQKIEWLAIMRGLNILLVVIGHAQLINIATGEPFPITDRFSSYLVPVRMPLFIFCSGGLLYLSRIKKNWTVSSLYRDKAQRILCPFLFFVTFYYILKMAMNVYVKTKVDYSVADFLLSFAIYSNHPSVHLWFLAVLMWFMLLYPLFRWLCQNDVTMWLFLAFSIGIYFIDTQPDPQRNYFFLFTLNHYLVYFFAGIFFFRFRLYEYLSYWWTTLLMVALYVLFYTQGLWLLTSMTGILAAVSLCRQLARFLPGLFSSFREYIYQIYLISLIFQGLVELILWRKLFYCPQMVLPFFVLNILLGLYVPVLISKLVERTSCRWLHLALGLKTATAQHCEGRAKGESDYRPTRLYYIDKLKALAMLLVVMGHTIYFCIWHETSFNDAVFNIICTFHVPLFFFLSGYVISQPPDIRKFLVKARKFLVPMLVIGFINALVFNGVKNFFLNSGHFGYWYLLTLTIFYLLLIPFGHLNRNKNNISSMIADIGLAMAFWLVAYLLIDTSGVFISALNPWGVFAYWHFFIIGYFCRKYTLTDFITGKPWLAVFLVVAYLTLLVISFSNIDSLPLILNFIIAITAIAALLTVFYFLDSINNNTFLNRQLLLIGTSTLHIYIYHFFFIRLIDLSFLKTASLTTELLIIIPLTLAIAYGSIILGKAVNALLKIVHLRLALIMLAFLAIPAQADNYDPDNYKPEVDTTKIEQTNLPIVFIDTRCGGEETQAIHMDWRIAARMKIISNADGINYGDTIEHPGQTVNFEGWIAIRYRGNTSFNYSAKKPYNFKTMKTADPDGDKLKTELLGMPKDNTWVLLAPYGDRSMLRDVLVWQLARPYFDYTPRCHYCELVLDGIYYGVFVLAENIRKGKYRLDLDDPGQSGDELTGGYQLQIDREDEPHFTSKYKAVDSIGNTYSAYNKIYLQYKHPDYEDMTPVQIEYIQQRVNQMEDALASDDFTNPNTGYRQFLDPMSFIDQQLSQEISGNVDGYRLSTNIYKQRDSQDPRFKTALWDFNLAFANSNSANAKGTDFWRYQNSYITNYNATNKVPFWWMRLMEDPAYVIQLKERYAQYRRENYSTEHIEATIDSITSLLREGGALERNNTTWKMFKSTTYDMEIDRIKQWLRERITWMDEQLDYEPSGMMMPTADFNKKIIGYYTLKGERIEAPRTNAITIVRYSDGTSRKIIRTSQ